MHITLNRVKCHAKSRIWAEFGKKFMQSFGIVIRGHTSLKDLRKGLKSPNLLSRAAGTSSIPSSNSSFYLEFLHFDWPKDIQIRVDLLIK